MAAHDQDSRELRDEYLTRRRQRDAADRRVSCPCECNSGGFCGGCGHAGCGGRIGTPTRARDLRVIEATVRQITRRRGGHDRLMKSIQPDRIIAEVDDALRGR